MFKFIKEIKEAMKEGWEEGKEDLAQEEQQRQAQERQKQEQERQKADADRDRLDLATFDERFGTALGAVYRDIYSGAMLGHKSDGPILALQIFDLPEANIEDMAMVLERDYDIVDAETARSSIDNFWREIRAEIDPLTDEPKMTGYAYLYTLLDAENLLGSNGVKIPNHKDRQVEAVQSLEAQLHLGPAGGDAFRLSVLSLIICGGCAVGYFSRAEALELIKPVNARAVEVYNSWEEYAAGYRAGELAWGYSNALARRFIRKAVERLLEHKDSPWKTIDWPA